jgi:ethanolamine utilization microcompartment shell protein EutL
VSIDEGTKMADVDVVYAKSFCAGAAVDRVLEIKAVVVARLGTDKYNDLLDKIIPQVMAQFNK